MEFQELYHRCFGDKTVAQTNRLNEVTSAVASNTDPENASQAELLRMQREAELSR